MPNELLDKLVSANVATGQTVKRSKKSVDLSQFQNIPSAITGANTYNPQTTAVSTSLSSLGTITTPYGGSTRYESFHPGVDVANKIGTPIPAFVGGSVAEVGNNAAGWGNYVIIKDKYGNKQRYSHLKNALVNIGDTVSSGQEIGEMGATGNVYSLTGGNGSHLDFRIKDIYNKYINPLTYLSQYGS
jgi:murein DD-endopeptidase MepM/ murein hydrolase activator NlpD